MAKANLVITNEMIEAGKVGYLPMAKRSSEPSKVSRGRLALQISIKNNESKPVAVKSVAVTIPGSQNPATTNSPRTLGMTIAKGQRRR